MRAAVVTLASGASNATGRGAAPKLGTSSAALREVGKSIESTLNNSELGNLIAVDSTRAENAGENPSLSTGLASR